MTVFSPFVSVSPKMHETPLCVQKISSCLTRMSVKSAIFLMCMSNINAMAHQKSRWNKWEFFQEVSNQLDCNSKSVWVQICVPPSDRRHCERLIPRMHLSSIYFCLRGNKAKQKCTFSFYIHLLHLPLTFFHSQIIYVYTWRGRRRWQTFIKGRFS